MNQTEFKNTFSGLFMLLASAFWMMVFFYMMALYNWLFPVSFSLFFINVFGGAIVIFAVILLLFVILKRKELIEDGEKIAD